MTKDSYAEYRLIHYHDVFGNYIDGWEVNDLCDVTETYGTITISDDASDDELIDYLIQIGYFTPRAKDQVCVEGDDTMIEFFEINNYPLCRLEKIRDVK